MAEENEQAAIESTGDVVPELRRTRRTVARRPSALRVVMPRRQSAVAKPAKAVREAKPQKAPKPAKTRQSIRPLRSLVVLSMVGGLVATVALPAYAANLPGSNEAQTLQQVAAGDAQSLVVTSDANTSDMSRDSYAATTPEEIAKKKAAEAAAARARLSAAATAMLVNVSMVSPGSGEVRWPILNFTKGRGLGDSGYHQGVDLLSNRGEPIYAAAAGVVRVSQESFGGYGVAVTIDHVIAGQRVSTLYGHMSYGTRQVVSGQTVQAGQLIGLVGSTGSSSANHLHFEVHINGVVADPWAWLQANAG